MEILLHGTTHTIDQKKLSGLDPLIVNDRELNGEINRASAQGEKFSLLLAMLEQNNLHRPVLHESPPDEIDKSEASALHHYRSSPLSANLESWEYLQQTSVLVNSGHVQTAQLWLAMHPQPLSLYNNALHVDEKIIANCSYPTQVRLQQDINKTIEVNEAGLYDILQELDGTAA